MSKQSEAQRLATVRKLTAELYSMQDRMNQAIDQITLLLQGGQVAEAMLPTMPGQGVEGSLERVHVPVALALPLASVYVNNPGSGHTLGDQCRFYSDYKQGQLQIVQVPGVRGSDARFGLNLNLANFDGTWMSLVFDARALLAGLPAGRTRLSLALEVRGEPQPRVSAKIGFRINGQNGEAPLNVRGNRVLVDSFEVPNLDPAAVEALDIHVVFIPHARACIELQRVALSVNVWPTVASEGISNVFEGAA